LKEKPVSAEELFLAGGVVFTNDLSLAEQPALAQKPVLEHSKI